MSTVDIANLSTTATEAIIEEIEDCWSGNLSDFIEYCHDNRHYELYKLQKSTARDDSGQKPFELVYINAETGHAVTLKISAIATEHNGGL